MMASGPDKVCRLILSGALTRGAGGRRNTGMPVTYTDKNKRLDLDAFERKA